MNTEIKREKVVDDLVLASCSSLSEERLEAMKKLLESMDLSFCIYDDVFGGLVDEHELAAGIEVNKMVGSMFADPSYHLREIVM